MWHYWWVVMGKETTVQPQSRAFNYQQSNQVRPVSNICFLRPGKDLKKEFGEWAIVTGANVLWNIWVSFWDTILPPKFRVL